MNLFDKIAVKFRIEKKFLLEQKWGLIRPEDCYTIPKYLLKKYLPRDPIIIDCGSHVGADSIELARIFPRGTIHAFEPVEEIYNHLVHNTRRFSNIHCYRMALGEKEGVASLNVSSGTSDASSSLLEPTGHKVNHPGVLFVKKTDVPVTTLDRWAEQNNISRIDFLWLDMQGFEYRMLSASNKLLPTVRAIHSEVSVREVYSGAMLYPQFRQWLSSIHFVVANEALPFGTDMGNVLFVKDNYSGK